MHVIWHFKWWSY